MNRSRPERAPLAPRMAAATLAALLGLVSLACDAGGLASAAKDTVKENTVGVNDPGVRRTIIIDPGHRPVDQILDQVHAVAVDSASRGQRITVRLVGGGNADAWRAVDLSSAHGGDLRREAQNPTHLRKEANANAEAVTAAVAAALRGFAYDGSGADLFGAIRRAATDPVLPREVVMVTGGGVHQTAALDTVSGYGNLPRLLDAIPAIEAPETEVVIIGAGDFTGAATTPSGEFSAAVAELWDHACARWRLRTCALADNPDYLAALESR